MAKETWYVVPKELRTEGFIPAGYYIYLDRISHIQGYLVGLKKDVTEGVPLSAIWEERRPVDEYNLYS